MCVSLLCLCSRKVLSGLLQVNSDLYPLSVGDTFTLALASSLSLDAADGASASTDRDAWRPGKGGLADEYEYVMQVPVFLLLTLQELMLDPRAGLGKCTSSTKAPKTPSPPTPASVASSWPSLAPTDMSQI